mmetsp:Transcript_33476/g.52699  ORF Transcript_33476/g.52699 Transcript_33476/m.52699 type:complete len:101 (+) Transcript_33476:411-713(+)
MPGVARTKRCERAGCSKERRFNFEREERGRVCAQHRVQYGQYDIKKNKRCKHFRCNNWPNFKFEPGGRFCGQHKADGMVNVMDAQEVQAYRVRQGAFLRL